MNYKRIVKNNITRCYKSLTPRQKGLRVFMYHSVQENLDSLNDLYVIDSRLFKDQMSFIKKNYKNILPFKELGIKDDEVTLSITFDDGFSDNLYIADPILQDLNLPYTVFIATDFIKFNKEGFLSSLELKELASKPNVDIGSHTATHPRLTTLSDYKVKEELRSSKHYLEDLLGKEINLFAYPHGDYDQRIRDFVGEAGYTIARNSRFSSNNKITDRLLVSSSEIWNTDLIKVFQDKINGHWDWIKYLQN